VDHPLEPGLRRVVEVKGDLTDLHVHRVGDAQARTPQSEREVLHLGLGPLLGEQPEVLPVERDGHLDRSRAVDRVDVGEPVRLDLHIDVEHMPFIPDRSLRPFLVVPL
jgi:hypothetical protein